MVTKNKKVFRTLYDTQGFQHLTNTGDDSPTDGSEYIPTEVLVSRFLRGDVLSIAHTPTYEFTDTPDTIKDVESVDSKINIDDEIETISEQLKLQGSETLKRTQLKLVQKMSQKKSNVKESAQQPPKPKAKAEGEAEGEPADKSVQPDASDKRPRRDA